MKKIFFSILLLLSFFSASAEANRNFLVNSDWLADHINDKNIVVLEVRYYPHRYYTVGHIPGAVQVQRFKDLGDNHANPVMKFPSRAAFQKTLRSWGVNNDSLIVIYDDSSTALASRVYFMLDMFGYNMHNVKILDGGTVEWTVFNELTKTPTKIVPGKVKLKPADKTKYVEWTDVYDDVVSRRDPSIVLLDARPHKMYTGKLIKHAILGGHIPGAINIVSLDGTDGQKWISETALAKMYSAIPKNKTVYAYCHDGFRMSLAYVQLKSLGYKHVRLYNGGWSDWGIKLSLPVIQGEKPYSGAFDL